MAEGQRAGEAGPGVLCQPEGLGFTSFWGFRDRARTTQCAGSPFF